MLEQAIMRPEFSVHGGRGRLAFMVVSTDTTVESDAYRLVPSGVSVHFDRIHLADVSVAGRAAMLQGVSASAKLLADIQPDGSAFACTSASVVIGDQLIIDHLQAVSRPRGLYYHHHRGGVRIKGTPDQDPHASKPLHERHHRTGDGVPCRTRL